MELVMVQWHKDASARFFPSLSLQFNRVKNLWKIAKQTLDSDKNPMSEKPKHSLSIDRIENRICIRVKSLWNANFSYFESNARSSAHSIHKEELNADFVEQEFGKEQSERRFTQRMLEKQTIKERPIK